MNERIKIKVKQMLDRGAKGLLRFRTAFLFSLFLFLIVFCRVAYMPGETSFDELFPVSLGYILISLGSTILFSVLWRLLLEWKHKVSLLYEAVNIPALAGFYLAYDADESLLCHVCGRSFLFSAMSVSFPLAKADGNRVVSSRFCVFCPSVRNCCFDDGAGWNLSSGH